MLFYTQTARPLIRAVNGLELEPGTERDGIHFIEPTSGPETRSSHFTRVLGWTAQEYDVFAAKVRTQMKMQSSKLYADLYVLLYA